MLSVLVVDDDELTGTLSSDLLKEGGFDVDLVSDSLQVIETLRGKNYDGVVLDILMPGMDGLTLCHKIKTDPTLKKIKIVMVSGKSFESEQKKAKELGASGFLIKPYDVNVFAKTISEIISAPKSQDISPLAASTQPMKLKTESNAELSIAILGSRGKNMKGSSKYGTHTPCLSLSTKEYALIFDAGSGINSLKSAIGPSEEKKEIRIFLTHFHRSHVEGLLDFSIAQNADSLIHIAAAPEPGKSLPVLLEEALKAPGKTFPKVRFELHELRERSYKILPKVILHAFHANHPGTSLGFIIETEGRKIAYAPDAEVYGPDATAFQDYDEKFSRLCEGADLLIHDAQYTQEDYEKNKSLGHSGFLNIVGLADKAKVQRLILFHQDARYDDATLKKMEEDAAQFLSRKNSPMTSEVAKEGVEIKI